MGTARGFFRGPTYGTRTLAIIWLTRKGVQDFDRGLQANRSVEYYRLKYFKALANAFCLRSLVPSFMQIVSSRGEKRYSVTTV